MKAVILAAGEGTRMRPLTDHTPKPLIQTVRRKRLLELIIEAFPSEVDEVVLVVGYKGDQIIEYFGYEYAIPLKPQRASDPGDPAEPGTWPLRHIRVSYAFQEKAEGTYRALELCRPLLSPGERFIMLYGDDVYGSNDLGKIGESKDLALLVSRVEDPSRFGILEVDAEGCITGVEEKPTHPKSNIASTGAMLLDDSVFKYEPKPGNKNEYVLADAIGMMVNAGVRFRAIEVNEWTPIGYPEDLKKLDRRQPKKTPAFVDALRESATASI